MKSAQCDNNNGLLVAGYLQINIWLLQTGRQVSCSILCLISSLYLLSWLKSMLACLVVVFLTEEKIFARFFVWLLI